MDLQQLAELVVQLGPAAGQSKPVSAPSAPAHYSLAIARGFAEDATVVCGRETDYFCPEAPHAMPHSILVVDDEPEVREILDVFLHTQLGYEVQSAAEGKAALDLALETSFDLCVLDVNMPGLTGPETYMRLKSLLPEIEAIFFTADRDFHESHTFLRFSLPLDRVITKPLEDFASLTQLIVSILGPPIL